MIFSLIILHFFAPLFVLFQLGFQQFSSRMEWLAALILATGVIVVVAMIGNWDGSVFTWYRSTVYCWFWRYGGQLHDILPSSSIVLR